jgi:hypothetical protein
LISDNSDSDEFSDFENIINQEEMTKILASPSKNLLEHQLWLTQLKLQKWERQQSKQPQNSQTDEFFNTKWKVDIYKAFAKQIKKQISRIGDKKREVKSTTKLFDFPSFTSGLNSAHY